ncbi:T-lymphocyte activation antigen CD80-like [Periophthalmus magnuspinnatus]|uniref:T-lymphocyte activation antigen CD80-like n=1 Tax=Periophthalmus magnuspinnatus TaxID=409849 RepID=UPI002436EFD5|nr:T-lymphocyte activation antigen CD80-like [Periophthalmus magnuspinnatus]
MTPSLRPHVSQENPLQWVMPVALWSFGLLLSFFTVCSSLDKDCIVGIVSHAVLLPCYHHNELLSFHNLSVEWRRGNELVLKAKWEEDGDVVIWSLNHATIPRNAPLTGNFSLELPKLSAKEDQMVYSLFVTSVENGSAPLCSMCLRTAARFSSPLLQRDETTGNNRTVFLCHSSGGFPKPTVYWLINDTEQPPEDSVWTDTTPLPDSSLYNVTSLLTVNISTDDSVSCSIQNQWMNETLTSKSREFVSFTGLFIRSGKRVICFYRFRAKYPQCLYSSCVVDCCLSIGGTRDNTIRSRASEGMWMFSTGLCVAVGIMVVVGIAYQIHLDRISKKRKVLYESTKAQRGYKKHQFLEETQEEALMSKETCV